MLNEQQYFCSQEYSITGAFCAITSRETWRLVRDIGIYHSGHRKLTWTLCHKVFCWSLAWQLWILLGAFCWVFLYHPVLLHSLLFSSWSSFPQGRVMSLCVFYVWPCPQHRARIQRLQIGLDWFIGPGSSRGTSALFWAQWGWAATNQVPKSLGGREIKERKYFCRAIPSHRIKEMHLWARLVSIMGTQWGLKEVPPMGAKQKIL